MVMTPNTGSLVVLDGVRLRALRHERNLSQAELASVTRFGIRTVRDAERGRPIGLQVALEIARALEISVEGLVPLDSLTARS
jgi:transcriptional regulator with XRE-family HTH domain